LQAFCVNSLLSKLVTLTQEREDVALEITLLRTLADFIATIHGEKAKKVVIYHLSDEKKQLLSALTIDEHKAEAAVSDSLKQSIINCFKSGEVRLHKETGDPHIKLYPLRNPASQIASVVGIDAQCIDMHLDVAISLLLQIYQNFTKLINDNESDTLTGLLNRKTFDYKINKILTQMQNTAKRKKDKTDQAYFLAIFDIDHFKRVNDQFGHLIGDEVLLMFSQLMRQSVREADPLFRFGGEEFVGVFECTSATDISMVLERFRRKVEQFTFPQVGKITVSTGYTVITEFDTPSQMIDRADSALYFAKNNGRNRVACYEQLIENGLLELAKKEGDIEIF